MVAFLSFKVYSICLKRIKKRNSQELNNRWPFLNKSKKQLGSAINKQYFPKRMKKIQSKILKNRKLKLKFNLEQENPKELIKQKFKLKKLKEDIRKSSRKNRVILKSKTK